MTQGVQSYHEGTADTVHGDITGQISAMEKALLDLTGFVNSVKGQWDGDEKDAYAAIQQKWDTNAGTVQGILTSVASALGQNTQSVKEMRAQVMAVLAFD